LDQVIREVKPVTKGVVMTLKRTRYGSKFKAKVALESLKGEKTLNELSKRYEVHASQISHWRGELLKRASELFERAGSEGGGKKGVRESELYEEIGRLKVEIDFLKKKSGLFEP
jgi:transposase